jgi:hypothetical protein
MNEIKKEIYGWSNVPEGWFTKTQLKEKGLKPKSKRRCGRNDICEE